MQEQKRTTQRVDIPKWSALLVLYRGIGYDADAIPERSAQKIFRAADQILRAGRPTKERSAELAN